METTAKRPWYLTALLVLVGLLYLLELALINLLPLSSLGITMPPWYVLATSIIYVLSVIGIILIFKWKKVGLYLFAGAMIVSIFFDYSTIAQTVTGVVFTLLPAALIYLSMRPVWSSFK